MHLEDQVAAHEAMEAGGPFLWAEAVRASCCVGYRGLPRGAFHRLAGTETEVEAEVGAGLGSGAGLERALGLGLGPVIGPVIGPVVGAVVEAVFGAGVGVAVFENLSGTKLGRDWLAKGLFGVVVVVLGRARRGIRLKVCVVRFLLCLVGLFYGAVRRYLVSGTVGRMNHFRCHMRRCWPGVPVAGAGLLLVLACRRGTVAACACLSDRCRGGTVSDVVDARAAGPY